MSVTDGPLAPWAFRAALSGLPEDQVRGLLEGDRCPEPDTENAWEEGTAVVPLGEDDEDIIICLTDREDAWIQSSAHVSLADAR